jgi:hypothetical protein
VDASERGRFKCGWECSATASKPASFQGRSDPPRSVRPSRLIKPFAGELMGAACT